ncbi:MAG: universal stress protein [Bacteroidota bacterium]
MKILVPTDFSKLSLIAINYALDFGEIINAEFIIVHVVNTKTPNMARIESKKLGEAIREFAEKDMVQLIGKIKKDRKDHTKITHKIIYGFSFENVIEEFALKNDVDIIIMGTKGATGLKKIFFGSNATSIIENSSIPVLTIPEYATYNSLENIVYASDLINLEQELEKLIPIAVLYKAWIHVLHITSNIEEEDEKTKLMVSKLEKRFNYPKVKIHEVVNEDIEAGINQYIADIDADMLAMYTHHLTVFELLFGKSITQDIAFQTRIPMLTFQKS